jgi:hypothetical protein
LGRPNLYCVFRYGASSEFEAIFRWSLVRMALEQRGRGGIRLWRTQAFRSLDPSEKGAINYFIGMNICKLFSAKLLGTPWLLHLDVFRDQLNPRILTGRSRPDFVGQETSSRSWHAFESKGRVTNPGAGDKIKAKSQAQRLVSVDGNACGLHIGAITFFKNDVLRFYWRDPEPEEPGRGEVQLGVPENAWRSYYEPVAQLLRAYPDTLTGSAEAPATVRIEVADISIGAHPEILSHLLHEDWQGARQIALSRAQELRELGYQPDGLIIKSGESWHLRYGT